MDINYPDSNNNLIDIFQVLLNIVNKKLQIPNLDNFKFKEFQGFLESPYEILSDNGLYKKHLTSFISSFDNIVLVGTGGSSLGAKSLVEICSVKARHYFYYANSTNEHEILKLKNKLDLTKTGFLISSKSGSTVEVISLFRYFYNEIEKNAEFNTAGSHFIAITESGSLLDTISNKHNFHTTIHTASSLVGRFSVFSPFGTCLAYMAGVSLTNIATGALSCLESIQKYDSENQVLTLTNFILEAIKSGKDKLVILPSKSLYPFALWIEQLIAESLGKKAKGIIPVIKDNYDEREQFSKDSMVIFLRNETSSELNNLIKGNHSQVMDFLITSDTELAFEMMKWQLATVAIGTVMNINPFNQPQVELSKNLASEFINNSQFEKDLFDKNGSEEDCIIALFKSIESSDYVCLLNYVNESPEIINELRDISLTISEILRIPCTVYNGPSYLHSTGQLHKGGPNTGVFIQFLSKESKSNTVIPQKKYTFDKLFISQADGDFTALSNLDRRICRIDIGIDLLGDLKRFHRLIKHRI
mgnify:CR=1 FL=1